MSIVTQKYVIYLYTQIDYMFYTHISIYECFIMYVLKMLKKYYYQVTLPVAV